jgi:threonine dehydrogenase-like Zn-dependent dehydrogenase
MAEMGKAVVMTGFKKPLEIREYPKPRAGPGAIVVKILMAGICGTDVHTWLGHTGGKEIKFPVILGHENVGEIIEMGEGVKEDWIGEPISIGDRITWTTTIGTYCYSCYNCVVAGIPVKCLRRKTYGAGISCEEPPHFVGGWAQYCYIFPKTAIFKLPRELKTESLVVAGCAAPTMIHAAERAGIRNGDTVVIQGCGAVGLFGLVVSKESGAEKVIVVGGPENRLKIAEEWGADHVINIDEMKNPEDRIKAVLDLTGGHGADVVFECSGNPHAFPEGVRMTRDGGTYVVVGQFMDAGPTTFHPFWITFKHIIIKGSYSFEPRHTFRAIQLLTRTQNKYKFEKMVTHKFPLEEANEALLIAREWKSIKAVFVPWSS